MKKSTTKTGVQKQATQKTEAHESITTDFPLSEKDEVKQAEEKMRKSAKK